MMEKKTCKLEYTSVSEEKKKEFLEDFFSGFKALKSSVTQQEAENKKRFFEAAKKSKANKESALTHETVKKVTHLASQVTDQISFDQTDKDLWELILAVNQLARDIQSCDLPSDSEDDAALVRLTQDFADKTLNNNDKSWLQKIIEIALYTKKTGFGNCQEKAFFGFAALLLESQKPWSLVSSLRLATFNNHFIVIVNERFLMDPWLNLAFPLDTKFPNENINTVFKGFGELVDYFSIDKQGHCFTHEVVVGGKTQSDKDSEKEMISCIQMLQKNLGYFDLLGIRKIQMKRKIEEDKKVLFQHHAEIDSSESYLTTEDVTVFEKENIDPVALKPTKKKKVEEYVGREEKTTSSLSSLTQHSIFPSTNEPSAPQPSRNDIQAREYRFI